MRQRKAKDLDKRLQECRDYIVPLPEGGGRSYGEIGGKAPSAQSPEHEAALRELWAHCFPRQRDLYLEIGCGKGDFITQKAAEDPESDFLAIEGQETVILRALEKACGTEPVELTGGVKREPLQNLKFMMVFVDHMSDYFLENQLSGVYLNFSDPWPKARHAKRRLTYRKRLLDYGWAIRPGGFLEIKTDNDPLYAFTLEELEAVGYEIVEQTTDLHHSDYAAQYVMTEYEKKFHSRGKNINYVKALVP